MVNSQVVVGRVILQIWRVAVKYVEYSFIDNESGWLSSLAMK